MFAGHCNPVQKDAHVQQFMWAGAKGNDLGVPLGSGNDGKLLQSKTAQWKEDFQPYSTTKSLAGQQVTDALAAGVPIKRQTCRWVRPLAVLSDRMVASDSLCFVHCLPLASCYACNSAWCMQ